MKAKYKNKTYTQDEARKMDYELDMVHELITELYNIEVCTPKIKSALDRIDKMKSGLTQ